MTDCQIPIADLNWLEAEIKRLRERIGELEKQLSAAEFAARHNWEGWQQEIKRSGTIIEECARAAERADISHYPSSMVVDAIAAAIRARKDKKP